MPVVVQVLVVTDEEGTVMRRPLYKSTLLRFEDKHGRPFNPASSKDQALLTYWLMKESWPPNNAELERWLDTITIESEEPEASNGANPTPPPSY